MLLNFYLQQGLLKSWLQQPAQFCGWMAEMIVFFLLLSHLLQYNLHNLLFYFVW